MRVENLKLSKVIDLVKWNELQDSIATVSNMAMITVDYKGNPVSKHSKCQKFCEMVRLDSNLLKYCKKCDSRGGLEAVQINKPYIYTCHFNIIDIAIPIIIGDKYIGAIMAGQVKLSDYNELEELEQIVNPSNKDLINETIVKYKEYYDDLPILSYEEVKNIANMLFILSKYLVEEALEKNLILEMYDKLSKDKHTVDSSTFLGYGVNSIENVKKEMSNAIINSYVEDNKYTSNNIAISKTLKPALDYIYKNKSENVSVKYMADICHISPSYFSRLFMKEMGECFSNYVSKLKIQWAKDLLQETDLSITEISNNLGFSEPGYFIKIFKNKEGVTPAIYRKYNMKNSKDTYIM